MAESAFDNTENIDPSVGGDLFERYFTGEATAQTVGPGTYFMTADYVNIAAFETSAGLLLVDCGMVEHGPTVMEEIRKLTDAPLHTVVYTHGHLDHAFGLQAWLEAGETPRVIAHENVVRRFRTYQRTGGLNAHANKVQFGIEESLHWPHDAGEFVWPDVTYRDSLTLRIGGEEFVLHHAMGETDDATWVHAPERDAVAVGDLFVGILPNCGNPQKVQRYPEEWAAALEAIASARPSLLLPGHGRPIEGADQIRSTCLETAEALRSIVDHVLEGLNAGRLHEDIVGDLRLPEHLAGRPYLDPLYDRPEFIARNVIRKYGGWWTGHPADVLPARKADQAKEISALAGGSDALVRRARELADTDMALACHLAEWAALGAPEDPEAHRCVIDLFSRRSDGEISLMGRGILSSAVRASQKALDTLGE